MGIIKKIIYLIMNKYHYCRLCKDGKLQVDNYKPYEDYEGKLANTTGSIYFKCPICKGSKIVWG